MAGKERKAESQFLLFSVLHWSSTWTDVASLGSLYSYVRINNLTI
jgi:hypothetical protein